MEEGNKVKGTEEKSKSLIDRFWWVIPPVFLVFVYWPLLFAISGSSYYRHDPWYEAVLKSIYWDLSGSLWFYHIQELLSLKDLGWVTPLFMFGFMLIGFIITKKMSVKYKILTLSILGAIGALAGVFAYFMVRGFEL